MGDGAAAWQALNERFDAQTQEARRACHNELFNLRHVAGGDPIDFFTKGWDLKLRLQVLGEEVSDDVYLDVLLTGLTKAPEFKFIKEMHYREEFTSVDRLQQTANRYYVDQQSRNASGPVVSGRGAAMAVASQNDQCNRCKAYGHFQRDCPQQPAHPEPSTFGFSFSALGASLAEATSSSASSQSGAKPAAPTSASSGTPASDHHLPQGFFGAFMAAPADLSVAPFRSDGSFIRMVVDSGATDNFLDPSLTPGVRAHVRDVEDLPVPHTIVAAGQNLLQGVVTWTITGSVADNSGHGRLVSFRVVLVPGLGTNLFSVTAAMQQGVATLFHPTNPGLESGDVVIPMQTLGMDDTTGKVMYSIDVKLGCGAGDQFLRNAPADRAFKATSADLWHRRMGHLNRRSLEVLKKDPVRGIEFTGDVQPCGTCPLGKSAQQPHPKQATYGALRPFQHVSADTLGPFSPPALGNFRYAEKFVDQQTKWKEVVLIKDKTCSVDSLALFNKGTVVPTGERIHCLRCDKGTEFTSAEFRQYCQDVGIQLEFASPNTPQQIGANERADRTILNIVRCLFADSTLPKFLWGELMQTAVYLINRSPHAALNNGTPYRALYGREAYLGNLRVIGSRAFVHEETFTKKLESRAWEGRLVGYSTDSRSYRIYNSETRRVRESRNVAFIETPPPAPSLDEKGFDDGEFVYDSHDDMLPDVVHRDGTFGFTEYAYALGTPQPGVPRNISEARAMPDAAKWNAAAEREMASLRERKVFKLVPRAAVPFGHKRIKSKWVFKRKADGSHKGRLVAQGWNQVPGLDCGSTFAPVCRMQSLRLVFCIAAEFNLRLDQLDVSTAFLYADIQEKVFVEHAPGFEVKGKDGDTCVYVYDRDGVKITLTLYVDDLLLAGNNAAAMSNVKNQLKQRFKMADMGKASLVLGMEIKRDREQGQLARPMAKPSKVHLAAAKQALRYLAGTTNFSITYKKGGFKLAAFSDSNWANNPDNGKSTSCYLMMLGNAPMSFKSGLQGPTAMSSMEAELIASALAMKEAVFCSNMLTELGFGKEFAQVPLYYDNTATLHALGNRSWSSRTKHIALRFFFIRELVLEGRITIHYVASNDNPADIGTKHFGKHQFKHLLDLIGSFDVDSYHNKQFNKK
eukprot:g5742.t1